MDIEKVAPLSDIINIDCSSGSGTNGTVTSVDLSVPSEFTLSGNPITTAGTITITKANQNANLFYAGPSSAPAAAPTFRAIVSSDLPVGTGTVTSVALTAPSIMSVSGSPVTTSGTLALSLATQVQKTFFAGPSSGVDATPTFRTLQSTDLPAGTGTVTNVAQTVPSIMSVSGSPITTSGTLAISLATQAANLVFAGPSTGANATPTFRSLVTADVSANMITNAKLAQMTAMTVKSRSANSTGDPGDLAAGTNFHVLYRDATPQLTFGLIDGRSLRSISCRVYRSTLYFLVPSGSSGANIDMDAEEFDTDSLHSTSTNPSRITIPTGMGGKWFIFGAAFAYYNTASGGGGTDVSVDTGLNILVGGVTKAATLVPGGSVGTIGIVLSLAAGDYIQMNLTHFYGSNLYTNASTASLMNIGAAMLGT